MTHHTVYFLLEWENIQVLRRGGGQKKVSAFFQGRGERRKFLLQIFVWGLTMISLSKKSL